MIGKFELLKTSKKTKARAGILHTAHGPVETPVFMPVGTQGTVKTLTPHMVEEMGASIILGNTYHLSLRPGVELIEKHGGLHEFSQWKKPILTDSGGYQVFSLKNIRKITKSSIQRNPKIHAEILRDLLDIRTILSTTKNIYYLMVEY